VSQAVKTGKILDQIAVIVGIENQNHHPNQEKLYLYHGRTGERLKNDLEISHPSNALKNGDSLILHKALEIVNPSDFDVK